MTDLEERLTAALTQGAQAAPTATGLAAAARSRARRGRRAKASGVAALAALCIGVPTAVVAIGGSDDERPRPSKVADGNTGGPGVPDGMRVESWHGVTALVPESWGYGSLQDWCASGGEPEPRVERPGGISLLIQCATSTYGLSFQELPPGQDRDQEFDWPVALQTSEGWPPDAYVGAHGIGDVLVQVTAPSEQQAREILATVRAIGPEGDVNGCPVDAGSDPVVPGHVMAVCRYDEAGALEQSERLDADEAASAEEAIGSAPYDTRRGPLCPSPHAPTTTIRMVSSAMDATVTFGGSCPLDTRVAFGDEGRTLGREVLYWALSPGWSGSVPDGVHLPSELRTR